MTRPAAIVFGGEGAIGASVAAEFDRQGYDVYRTSRSQGSGDGRHLIIDLDASDHMAEAFQALPVLDAAVWAQGTNRNDSVVEFDPSGFEAVLRANLTFVVRTLAELLHLDKLANGARLCVISSIWEAIARRSKLSYTVSKAALGGFVRATAMDLADRSILVNAVLPGVVDTAMTRSMLSSDQIQSFEQATGFGRLVTLEDVANATWYLCSPSNTGVTGQSLCVDLGFSHGRSL